jgi:hypothetical protein
MGGGEGNQEAGPMDDGKTGKLLMKGHKMGKS